MDEIGSVPLLLLRRSNGIVMLKHLDRFVHLKYDKTKRMYLRYSPGDEEFCIMVNAMFLLIWRG